MIIVDVSNPVILLIAVLLTVLIIFISKETKRSVVLAINLFAFLMLLIIHFMQIVTGVNEEVQVNIIRCITLDLLLILITFLAYLWVDDIEARLLKKKSIDNSLDWFWKKL